MKFAFLDLGSFTLPYDSQLIKSIVAHGNEVDFFASETKYNGEFLRSLDNCEGCSVTSRRISSSVSNRGEGLLNYLKLFFLVIKNRRKYNYIIVQILPLWPLDLLLIFFVRKKIILNIHNPVPHHYKGRAYLPYKIASKFAKFIWFPSQFTFDQFIEKYPEIDSSKFKIVQHGCLPVLPDGKSESYTTTGKPEGVGYFGTIKPYKGIENFLRLSGSLGSSDVLAKIYIYGRWSASLSPIKREMIRKGFVVKDKFLEPIELEAVLKMDLLFILPYRNATQSGVLYTLLNHGRFFLAHDVGDIGYFLKKYDLRELILEELNYENVLASLAWLVENMNYVKERLNQAQKDHSWKNVHTVLDELANG